MTNVYGYCRFSSDKQNECSIEAQKNAIKVYARDKDYNIIGWYCDRAISGKTANHRPEFLKMFADLKKREATAVMVHKLDRFSRSQADYAIYTRELELMEVELVSVMERLDDSPSGKLLQAVISSINEFYVNNLSHEVMKGLKLNASKALFNGGVPPLGYKIVNQHYELEETEAQAVHLIFNLYDQDYHYGQIQHQLNTLGYKTKAGNPFGKNSLFDILRRECYTGVYVYNKTQKRRSDGSRSGKSKPEEEIIRVHDAIPAIVSKALWNRVQKRMDETRDKGGRHKAKELYLLSGIAHCGLCGHSYCGHGRYPGKDRPKFIAYCCSYRHQTHACTNREIKRDVLEGYVLNIIQAHVLNPSIVPRLTKELNSYLATTSSETMQDTKQYRTRLAELERDKSNIIDAIAKTGYGELFEERLSQIEMEIQTLSGILNKLRITVQTPQVTEDMVREYFKQFQSCIAERDIPQIKKFIRSCVKRVEVYPDMIKVFLIVALAAEDGFPIDSQYEFEVSESRTSLKSA